MSKGRNVVTSNDGAIDVHAHIVAAGLPEALRGIHPDYAPAFTETAEGIRVKTPWGRMSGAMPRGMLEIDARLADMDEMGIWHQAISPPPFMFPYGLPADVAAEYSRTQNDTMLAVAADHPERISVLCDLPMQDADASLRELERIGRDPHVRGIAIGSAVDDTNLDDEKFEAIWEAAAELDLGILVHPVDAAGKERMTRFYLRNLVGNPVDSTLAMASIIFSGVLERYPSLRFCFLHGGGFGPYQIGRWDHGWRHIGPSHEIIDRPPRDFFEQLFFDSLTHDRLSLDFLLRRVGPHRVVVGTDYMFQMGDREAVQHVLDLELPTDVQELVLRKNADEFLR